LIAYLEKRDTARGVIGRVAIDDSIVDDDGSREGEPSKLLNPPVNVRAREVDV
jgi:ACS family pantothenate transporter-like MFS transporter